MKNIKVSMLAFSLVAVSASASEVPEAAKTAVSWLSKLPSMPKVPAAFAKVVPDPRAQAAVIVTVAAGLGYAAYKYGVFGKLANAGKYLAKKAYEHKGKLLIATAVVATAYFAAKKGVHTKAIAAVKALFTKAPKVEAVKEIAKDEAAKEATELALKEAAKQAAELASKKN